MVHAQEARTEEIVVEADRLHDAMSSATSLTVIPIDERITASSDVASVLSTVPGVVVRRLGGLGDYSSVSIRASGARHVQIYLDGVPLNPDGSSTINLSELPLNGLERIEVYRGNAPAEFDAAPIGGVINLVTKTNSDSVNASLMRGQLQTTRISVNGGKHFTIGGRPSDVLLMAEGFQTEGDFSYFTDNGTIYNVMDDAILIRGNNDKRQLNTLARARLSFPGWTLNIADSFLFREEGMPGTSTSPAEHVRLQSQRNLGTAELAGGNQTLSWKLRGWRLVREELYDDRQGELGIGTQWDQNALTTNGLLAHTGWVINPWLATTLTGSMRHDGFNRTDQLTNTTDAPRKRTSWSGSMGTQAWLFNERIEISPVLQSNLINNQHLGDVPFEGVPITSSGEEIVTAVNPRIGVLVQSARKNVVLKSNVGRYLRPPDFTELFGDQGTVIGNAELLPERGMQWDIGVHGRLQADSAVRVEGGATFFGNSILDQIVFVQNSQRTSVPINIGESQTHGLESALYIQAWTWLDSQTSLTWTQSENLTNRTDVQGNRLPRVPEWEVGQTTSLKWSEILHAGHNVQFIDGNYWDATNFYLAPQRTIHSAHVRLSWNSWSAETSVLNLTNQTLGVMDRNPLSEDDNTPIITSITDFSGYPMPGRTWIFSLAWNKQTQMEQP